MFVFLTDPEYKKFLEYYNGDEEKFTSSPEILLEELEAKSKELGGRKSHAFCLVNRKKINSFLNVTFVVNFYIY